MLRRVGTPPLASRYVFVTYLRRYASTLVSPIAGKYYLDNAERTDRVSAGTSRYSQPRHDGHANRTDARARHSRERTTSTYPTRWRVRLRSERRLMGELRGFHWRP